MNQIQIENLSTEEYSYFLGHGVIDYSKKDYNMLLLDQSFGEGFETSNGEDERVLSQSIENVCGFKEQDSV